MNQVTLIGRLVKDPETAYTQSGLATAKFTLAVDRMKDGADFIRITAFGKTAELCDRYLAKGRQVAVQGRIQTGSYEKDGHPVFTTDVIADRIEFIGSAKAEKVEPTEAQKEQIVKDTFSAAEDDIPF